MAEPLSESDLLEFELLKEPLLKLVRLLANDDESDGIDKRERSMLLGASVYKEPALKTYARVSMALGLMPSDILFDGEPQGVNAQALQIRSRIWGNPQMES